MRCSIRASSTRIETEQELGAALAIIDHQADLGGASTVVGGVRGSFGHLLRRYPLGAAGAVLVAAIVLMALFADCITACDPTATDPRAAPATPAGRHPL